MKNKTIRKQIMISMFMVLFIQFVINMIFSNMEKSIIRNMMNSELGNYVISVLDSEINTGDSSEVRKAFENDEFYELVAKEVIGSLIKLGISYLFTTVLLIVAVTLYSRWSANRIVAPINQLEKQMKEVGEGHFDKMVKVDKAPKELEGLADDFNAMTVSLREYIDKLTKTTSDNDKLNMELTLMRQIQANMLPTRYPTLNNVMMHADAWRFSKLGVAFYDFFSVDDQKLAMIVGDVSDQGVMATLYAVMSQNFIRGFTKMGYAPSRVLAETNNLLSEKNEFGLNISVTIVLIDHGTGEMSYAMAGGGAPILRQTGEATRPVSDEMTIPLGNMENVVYHTYKTRLVQGDTLAVYSDGVVSAKNSEGERFGQERLMEAITSRLGYELSEASDEIYSRITDFTGGITQSEDGMMILFRYLG